MSPISERAPVIIRQLVLAAMYFFSLANFGAAALPSVLVTFIIFFAGLINLERRLLSVIGIVLFLIAAGISLALFPAPHDWKLPASMSQTRPS